MESLRYLLPWLVLPGANRDRASVSNHLRRLYCQGGLARDDEVRSTAFHDQSAQLQPITQSRQKPGCCRIQNRSCLFGKFLKFLLIGLDLISIAPKIMPTRVDLN